MLMTMLSVRTSPMTPVLPFVQVQGSVAFGEGSISSENHSRLPG